MKGKRQRIKHQGCGEIIAKMSLRKKTRNSLLNLLAFLHFLIKQITSTINRKQKHYQGLRGEVKFGLNRKLCLGNWALRKLSLKSERLLLETLKRVFEKPIQNCRLSNGLKRNPLILCVRVCCDLHE